MKKIGCTVCIEIKNLGVRASRGVNISIQWAEGTVSSYGTTREAQLSPLRIKIYEHKNSQARNSATSILKTS